MFCSLCAGIAGILEVGWLGTITTSLGQGMELTVIAAAVIGGANLAGGIGTAFGAVVGAALIEVIRNSLTLLGISTFWQGTFVGSFIIVAVAVRPAAGRPRRRLTAAAGAWYPEGTRGGVPPLPESRNPSIPMTFRGRSPRLREDTGRARYTDGVLASQTHWRP